MEVITTCPYCKDSVVESAAVLCPACDTAHHEECWESNNGLCSVFGCKSRGEDHVLGCPWCNEVYIHERRTACMNCDSALMTPEEYFNFVQGHDWVQVQTDDVLNPLLALGYLRNFEILARIERRPPVSMLLSRPPVLFVARQHESEAREMLKELTDSYIPCEKCGHILKLDERVCSFCNESGVE